MMAVKADRGTKRVCQNPQCRSKFYDLNRTPIICPICHTPFELRAPAPKPAFAAGKSAPLDEDAVLGAAVDEGAEFVPLEDADAASDLGDLDADDVADIGDDADIAGVDDEEAFLEEDDVGDADVTGFVGGVPSDDDA